MKKLLCILTILLISANCFADESHKFYKRTIQFADMTVGSGLSEEYDLDLEGLRPQGFASLQIEVSGSGTMQITHKSSNDGVNFYAVDGFNNIVTALTAGGALYAFDLPFAQHLQLVFTETGGTNTITIDKATLLIQ